MKSYGKKGGQGPTAGRKAETIAAEGHKKRVFFGQRILVFNTSKGKPLLVRAAPDTETAQRWADQCANEGDTGRWVWAETVNGQPFQAPAGATTAPVDFVKVLMDLKEKGLTFGDCVHAFGVQREENPFARYAEKNLTREGETEVDCPTVLSESDEGAYVMAWLWVSNEDAGVASEEEAEEEATQ